MLHCRGKLEEQESHGSNKWGLNKVCQLFTQFCQVSEGNEAHFCERCVMRMDSQKLHQGGDYSHANQLGLQCVWGCKDIKYTILFFAFTCINASKWKCNCKINISVFIIVTLHTLVQQLFECWFKCKHLNITNTNKGKKDWY